MEANVKFANSIVVIGNITGFFVEVMVVTLAYFSKTSGFYDNALMRGATRLSFVLSLMVWQFTICFIY